MVYPIPKKNYYNPYTLFRPGLYCIAVHTHIRSKKKDGGINIAIYPLSILFMLCTIYCAIDTAQTVFTVSMVLFLFFSPIHFNTLGAYFF